MPLILINCQDSSYSLTKEYQECYDPGTDRFRNTFTHQLSSGKIDYQMRKNLIKLMRSARSHFAFKSDSLLNSGKRLLRKFQRIFESLNFCNSQTKNCENVLIIGSSTVAFLFCLTFLVFGRVDFGTGFFSEFLLLG